MRFSVAHGARIWRKMFDFGIGSTELLVIAVVALLVVGPKDLPRLLRTIGSVVTKVRAMAREFQGHIDEAIKDTGLDDIKNSVSKVKEFSVADLDKEFEELEKEFRETAMPKEGEPGNETLFEDTDAAKEKTDDIPSLDADKPDGSDKPSQEASSEQGADEKPAGKGA
jgi:sec-independent protein translocase protein TatB